MKIINCILKFIRTTFHFREEDEGYNLKIYTDVNVKCSLKTHVFSQINFIMEHHGKKKIMKLSTREKLSQRKKESKHKLKEKRARLFVKNLPFKVTENDLQEHFGKYGEITKIDILKQEDGKLKGCGFIQYSLVQKAKKARHYTNGKPFMGRDIIVDFAKASDKYKVKENKIEDTKEGETSSKEEIKEEDVECVEVDVKEEGDDVNDKSDESDDDDKSENSDNSDDDEDKVEVKAPQRISNDVTEGRTIFIKNVPFDATNEDVKQCMYKYGPIFYALVCIDKYTEHSKGTAFVKFMNKEDAEKALNAGTELTLMGNVLDCHPALGRNEIGQKINSSKEEKKEHKDSRNLYLVKEGVILAGTKAAEGVSAADMAKRLQLEQYKTQMLRNLNMFVSRERLVVHNLPVSWDDSKLRTLFQKYAGEGVVIKEARIMRDMRNVDANGVGKSKEFGFVAFTKHEHALTALRALNNNPNIFSAHKRPIITFSIENKTMIKARQKRLEKSRQMNPKSKEYVQKSLPANTKMNNKFNNKNKSKNKQSASNSKVSEANNESEAVNKFAGVTAKPGPQKMRSRYKLTTQAKLHHENLKKEKKKLKMSKKSFGERKQEFTKQGKQKVNKKVQSDNFSKLVNDYKSKLNSVPVSQKSKWFES